MPVLEVDRLERLWKGEFGDAYTERCANAGANRGLFWDAIRRLWPFDSVLEVGCNVGGNLIHLANAETVVTGLDINPAALREARERLPGVELVEGSARSLPFLNASYDLVFTCGVLIHQDIGSLYQVMAEMVRVSGRYVLAMEYYAERREEVPYRDQSGALFRDDYGRRFLQWHHNLKGIATGFVGAPLGFDSTTFWLFEKS